MEVIPTPGHIDHHLAYLHRDSGTLLAGDALGIILTREAPTVPPTPPPSLDLRAWHGTLERLERVEAERIAVSHFGLHPDLEARREELGAALRKLESRVRRALAREDEGAAERYAAEVVEAQAPHLPDGRAEGYFQVFGGEIDWRGVEFYLERNPEA